MADQPGTTLPDEIRPAMFEAVIINESDTVCVAFKKLIHFSVLIYRFMKWMYLDPTLAANDPSNALSGSFKAMVCGSDCTTPSIGIPV